MSSSSSPQEENLPLIIGVKLGSYSTVIGTLNNSVLDVLYSDTSSRTIPSLITYTDKFILTGDSAQLVHLKNINTSFPYLNRLLCLSKETEQYIAHEKQFILFPLNNINNSHYVIGSTNYNPELALASFLHSISLIWQRRKNKKFTTEVVISIPDYYSPLQKIALLNVIKISDIKCVSLLNESSAICLSYFHHHFRDITLYNKGEDIIFVDMGDTKTAIHICNISKHAPSIIFSKSNKELGCRDFDFAILQYLLGIYKDTLGKKITSNPKMQHKVMSSISKGRKILTVNTETVINIELFDDDNDDINITITRDQFKDICTNELMKFKTLIESTINESKININNIKSIEMVGDSIRNPIFQEIIFDQFKMTISKTLLADECIARGCALYSVMQSDYYSTIQDFDFYQYNQYVIKYKIWNTMINSYQTVLDKGENYPVKKVFKYHKKYIYNSKEPFVNIMFYYENNSCSKEEDNVQMNSIIGYKVYLPFETVDTPYTLSIEIIIDLNGLPAIALGTAEYENNIRPQFRCMVERCYSYNSLGNKVNINDLIIDEILLEFKTYINTTLNNRRNEIESLLYSLRASLNNNERKVNINELLSQIEESQDINFLNEKYEYVIKESKSDKHIEFINIEKAIRDNINLLMLNKDNIQKERLITIGKYIIELINNENEMKSNYTTLSKSEQDQLLDSINKYKNDILLSKK